MSFRRTIVFVPFINNAFRTVVIPRILVSKVQRPCSILEHSKSYSSASSNSEDNSANVGTSGIVNKAMQAYLERSRHEETFMTEQEVQFEIGKRHLANMMGENPETFTQKDVDDAIAYLLPSGLHNPRARPHLKHPHQIFPKRKSAEFDTHGRPFHSLFYTGRPNYYQVLQETSLKAAEMDQRTTVSPSEKNLRSSLWILKAGFEQIVLEKVTDDLYEFFIRSMDRLLEHPRVDLEIDGPFFMKYRKPIQSGSMDGIPQLMFNDAGIPYMKSSQRRKMAFCDVIVYGRGTGKMTINGQDILYFANHQDRDQVLFPLQFTGLLGLVDVEATVKGGGTTGQSGAIRHAISMALRSFVDDDTREKMRISGLLTRDLRQVERQKPGMVGARKPIKWKPR